MTISRMSACYQYAICSIKISCQKQIMIYPAWAHYSYNIQGWWNIFAGCSRHICCRIGAPVTQKTYYPWFKFLCLHESSIFILINILITFLHTLVRIIPLLQQYQRIQNDSEKNRKRIKLIRLIITKTELVLNAFLSHHPYKTSRFYQCDCTMPGYLRERKDNLPTLPVYHLLPYLE